MSESSKLKGKTVLRYHFLLLFLLFLGSNLLKACLEFFLRKPRTSWVAGSAASASTSTRRIVFRDELFDWGTDTWGTFRGTGDREHERVDDRCLGACRANEMVLFTDLWPETAGWSWSVIGLAWGLVTWDRRDVCNGLVPALWTVAKTGCWETGERRWHSHLQWHTHEHEVSEQHWGTRRSGSAVIGVAAAATATAEAPFAGDRFALCGTEVESDVVEVNVRRSVSQTTETGAVSWIEHSRDEETIVASGKTCVCGNMIKRHTYFISNCLADSIERFVSREFKRNRSGEFKKNFKWYENL